jgi:transcriptional regulator with XRE-family HTH domain
MSATINKNTDEVYYVYPRLMSCMKSERVTVAELAAKAAISVTTVSKIRSGEQVGQEMIDACKVALKSLAKGIFDFEQEKMSAQLHYNQKDVKAYIGNRPKSEAAESLGIETYMLEWIFAEKKVSEDFHKKYIANKI